MALGLAGFLAGCSEQAKVARQHDRPATQQAAAPASQAELLQPLVMAQKPAGAISVTQALQSKEGDKVIVSGRTPTAKVKPFNPAVAAFVLMPPEALEREDVKEEFDCDKAAT
jgi:hypothetical protein